MRLLCNLSRLGCPSLVRAMVHSASSMSVRGAATVGILIIGDEILKGRVQDTNSKFLAAKCYENGVSVKKISIIPDDVDVISKSIDECSRDFDVVLSSGGIGPTHDDLTYEGAASAFGDHLEFNTEILELIRRWIKLSPKETNHPSFKMARIPSESKLNYGNGNKFPVVSTRNVYFFPGIPDFLEKSFENIFVDIFSPFSALKFKTRNIFTTLDEISLSASLEGLVRKYPDLSFGSYPRFKNAQYNTEITMEAKDDLEGNKLIKEAYEEVTKVISGIERAKESLSGDVYDKIQRFVKDSSTPNLRESVELSLTVLEKCFSEYNDEEIFLCFNGGKDCIVVLHLVMACYWKLKGRTNSLKFNALYIRESDPFEEVEKLIEELKDLYNLNLVIVPGGVKAGLKKLLEIHPRCKTVILGTRQADPYSSVTHFCKTTQGWPEVMRVSPILKWKYRTVWDFILGLNLRYPSLYDEGYTSLGGSLNTRPNPALRVESSDGKFYYKAAYLLEEDSMERAGRV